MTPPVTTTPIPPGIEVPSEVRSRLGTLRFFDGFPDRSPIVRLYGPLEPCFDRTWRLPDIEPST